MCFLLPSLLLFALHRDSGIKSSQMLTHVMCDHASWLNSQPEYRLADPKGKFLFTTWTLVSLSLQSANPRPPRLPKPISHPGFLGPRRGALPGQRSPGPWTQTLETCAVAFIYGFGVCRVLESLLKRALFWRSGGSPFWPHSEASRILDLVVP